MMGTRLIRSNCLLHFEQVEKLLFPWAGVEDSILVRITNQRYDLVFLFNIIIQQRELSRSNISIY